MGSICKKTAPQDDDIDIIDKQMKQSMKDNKYSIRKNRSSTNN
jgi:hypothetical protein